MIDTKDCGVCPLRQFLNHPDSWVALKELALVWQYTDINIICERPVGLVEGPWLPGALRGAWGRQLYHHQQFERDETDPFGRPAAYDVFFESQGTYGRRRQIPPGFIIQVDYQGQEVHIKLRLFGAAAYWRPVAQAAMIAALRDSIALNMKGTIQAPFKVLHAHWLRKEGIRELVPVAQQQIEVTCVTPLNLEAEGAIKGHFRDFFFSLAQRVAGLSRWQGGGLNMNWREMRTLSQKIAIEGVDMWLDNWVRHSIKQKNYEIPMHGYMGKFRIESTALTNSLLSFAEVCHVGSKCAFGLGRVNLHHIDL